MGKINWTQESERWLRDIHDYIALDSPKAAASTIQGIFDKVQFLEIHPRMGHHYMVVTDREIRSLLYGHYRIGYLVKGDAAIDILGVFHGSLDINRYLY